MADLYGKLGLHRTASDEQVKAAFRRLAKTCHPDLNHGDRRAECRFKEIALAYETLGNPAARALYDARCAQERMMARQRLRGFAATMSTSFLLTVAFGTMLGAWLAG